MADRDDLSEPLLPNSTLPIPVDRLRQPIQDDISTSHVSERDISSSWHNTPSHPVGTSAGAHHGDSPATLPGIHLRGSHPLYTKPQPQHTRSMKRGPIGTARARRLPWICLDDQGHRSFVLADKRALIANTGLHIPIRDMRLLDFNLVTSMDSTILVRDNAIIASLEHIRLIVTSGRVIIPREGAEVNPLVARFVDVLEEAIVEWARQKRDYEQQLAQELNGGEADDTVMSSIKEVGSVSDLTNTYNGRPNPNNTTAFQNNFDNEETSSVSTMRHELQPLPFELVVLEAGLNEVVTAMSAQIHELEAVALPALDALTKAVSSGNLERVRKVKTRHQRLIIRTEALRDELQRFLQDDDDMTRMCLTRRKELEDITRAAAATFALNDTTIGTGGGPGDTSSPTQAQPSLTPFVPGTSLHRRSSLALARASLGLSSQVASHSSPPRIQTTSGASALPSREAFLSMTTPSNAAAAAAQAAEEDADAEAQQEVENLLESYYMQVDSLYDRLVSIGEYIKDTEEYINIELDSYRNRMIRMEIVLAVSTFSIMPFNLLAGILGENLVIPPQITGNVDRFWTVNFVAGAVCLTLFYSIMLYMRYTKLI